MIARIYCMMLVVGVAAPASAQELQGWAHQFLSDNGKPAADHDFGTVAKGAMLQHRIQVTNKYAMPFTIQLGVSCDCVKVVSQKAVLQPKETTSLDIDMDTRRFNGKKDVVIYFTVTNQQFNKFSTALVKVSANCRTDVAMNPGVVNFAIVPRGESRTSQVTVEYAGETGQ